MSSISFMGSYSGIDRATIDQLMQAERIPLNQLNSKKTSITAQQNAWKDVNTRLNSLFDKLKALQSPATFNTMKPVSSNEDILTALASSDAVAGRYEINVKELATSVRITGTKIENAYDLEGKFRNLDTEGNITINGREIEINTNDNLKSIVNKINEVTKDSKDKNGDTIKGTGINATVVDGRIVLTDEQTGDRSIALSDDKGGNTLSALGINTSVDEENGGPKITDGQQAVFTINGIEIKRDSNTVTDAVLGLTINLEEKGTTVINVSNDTEKLSKAVQDFVDQYNSTMGFINEQLAVGTVTDEGTVGRGALAGDSSLRSLQDSLRRMVTDRLGNPGTNIDNISELGVTTTDKSGVLSFDSSKLLEAFSKDPQDVINFFGFSVDGEDKGFVEKLNSRIDSYISSSDGLIKSKNESFDRSLKDLNDRIDRFNDRMIRREEYYVRTFTALDVAMMEAESQMSWLTSQIQGMNAQMGANNR